jgi:hypothetical protein
VSPAQEHDREELTEEQEEGSRTVRIVVRVAIAIAALVVAYVLLFGGSEYTITAEFQNAAQLVPGSQVVVAGVPTGSVKDIALGDHGQALVTFTVSDPYVPLRQGTTATIRSYSLSGIANRQIQLDLPPTSQAGSELPSGSVLPESQTVSEVDLDQLFNTLNANTIKNFKHVIEGFASVGGPRRPLGRHLGPDPQREPDDGGDRLPVERPKAVAGSPPGLHAPVEHHLRQPPRHPR